MGALCNVVLVADLSAVLGRMIKEWRDRDSAMAARARKRASAD